MRESMGGMWLFSIAIIFISLFSAFLAYSISYTKAFNLKNQVLEQIEKDEGYTKSNDPAALTNDVNIVLNNEVDVNDDNIDKSTEAKIYSYLVPLGYNYSTAEYYANKHCIEDKTGQSNVAYSAKGGYCVYKYCELRANDGKENGTMTHYKVSAYISLKIPFFDFMIAVPVSGETRTLYYDQGNMECFE